MLRRHLALVFILALPACGGGADDDASTPGAGMAETEPRVALQPTAAGELPPAIVG